MLVTDQLIPDASRARCANSFEMFVWLLGQLKLEHGSLTKQYKFGTSVSLEGNRRSGVAMAMRHRQQWYYHLRAHGLRKGDEHPA